MAEPNQEPEFHAPLNVLARQKFAAFVAIYGGTEAGALVFGGGDILPRLGVDALLTVAAWRLLQRRGFRLARNILDGERGPARFNPVEETAAAGELPLDSAAPDTV